MHQEVRQVWRVTSWECSVGKVGKFELEVPISRKPGADIPSVL